MLLFTLFTLSRQNSLYKRSESGDYIVNDIGKLRQELKDALKVIFIV